MHQAEEDILVLAAQNGNQQAFRMIFLHYQKPLLRYAFKVCNDQEVAQDAVQEAWLKLANNIRSLNDPRALRSWIFRLVRWRVIDLMRQANRHNVNTDEFEDGRHGEIVERNINGSDELSMAIKSLPSLEQQMIHLFYLEELRINEIAVVLEIPSGTVKSRLNRARKLLKQKFDG